MKRIVSKYGSRRGRDNCQPSAEPSSSLSEKHRLFRKKITTSGDSLLNTTTHAIHDSPQRMITQPPRRQTYVRVIFYCGGYARVSSQLVLCGAVCVHRVRRL